MIYGLLESDSVLLNNIRKTL